jgi:flavodoxin
MKAYIAVDSVYGCTKAVADGLAEGLRARGIETTVAFLKDKPWPPAEGDILFVGSPTRFAKMTRPAKKFVKKLKKEQWQGKQVFTFDTVSKEPTDPEQKKKAEKWTAHGAAHKLRDMLEAEGIKVRPEMFRGEVVGMKGPLAAEEVEKAKAFARDLKL